MNQFPLNRESGWPKKSEVYYFLVSIPTTTTTTTITNLKLIQMADMAASEPTETERATKPLVVAVLTYDQFGIMFKKLIAESM